MLSTESINIGTPIHLQTLLPSPEQIEKCRSRGVFESLEKKHIMDFDFTSELNYNRDRSASSLESLLETISLGLVVYLRNFPFS